MSQLPYIVLGSGGHSRVVVDLLLALNQRVIGHTDADPKLKGQLRHGVPVLGGDDEILRYSPSEVHLANGLGSIGSNQARAKLFQDWESKGYRFPQLIHPFTWVSPSVEIGAGTVIMAGSVIQTGTRIGKNVIVNTGSKVDHDCFIAEHAHLAPGVTLSGGVKIGAYTHVGTGAVVIQGIELGNHCLVGAGSVVVKNYPNDSRLIGVPAEPMETR